MGWVSVRERHPSVPAAVARLNRPIEKRAYARPGRGRVASDAGDFGWTRACVRAVGRSRRLPGPLLHGTPGCRLERWPDEDLYRRLGVFVVTHDRAGYGRSTRRPGRRIVDEVDDVVALADHLGLERFGVAGGSGGGAHALACAALLARPGCARGVRRRCRAAWEAGARPGLLACGHGSRRTSRSSVGLKPGRGPGPGA